jgi:hypothetical protein
MSEILNAEEWLCKECNTVFPGPPQAGVYCIICPKCGGVTGPRDRIEYELNLAALTDKLRQATEENRKLAERPTIDAWTAACRALDRKNDEMKTRFTVEQVRVAISNTLCAHKFLHDLTILGIEKLCNAVCAKLAKEQYTTRPNTVLGGTDILLDGELIATLSPKCKVTPEEFIRRVK